MSVTFLQYLNLTEDNATDIAKLQSDIAAIDAQINMRITPLNTRKAALQKMLAQKQKIQQSTPAQPQQQQQPMA